MSTPKENERSESGWMFKCDGCGKTAECAAPIFKDAVADAQDAGWTFCTVNHTPTDLCPVCSQRPL